MNLEIFRRYAHPGKPRLFQGIGDLALIGQPLQGEIFMIRTFLKRLKELPECVAPEYRKI